MMSKGSKYKFLNRSLFNEEKIICVLFAVTIFNDIQYKRKLRIYD